MEAVRYQAWQVRDALVGVRETTTDLVVKVKAQSLVEVLPVLNLQLL